MRKEFHERNSWPHRLMRISKATPVSMSREWCSTRTMVSRKVTFILRKTANTQTVCDNIQLASHLTVLLHDATIQMYRITLLDTRNDTHLSRWSVQTFPAPPVDQAALLTPRVGPSGTPGPAACWTSCWTSTLGNPSFHLTEIRENN